MITISVQTVTIPNGGNSVTFTQPSGVSLRAIRTPATFEGTTLTFEAGASTPGAPLFDGAAAYSLPSGANRFIPITKQELFFASSVIKVTSNVAGNPSNVAADRVLELYFGST